MQHLENTVKYTVTSKCSRRRSLTGIVQDAMKFYLMAFLFAASVSDGYSYPPSHPVWFSPRYRVSPNYEPSSSLTLLVFLYVGRPFTAKYVVYQIVSFSVSAN